MDQFENIIFALDVHQRIPELALKFEFCSLNHDKLGINPIFRLFLLRYLLNRVVLVVTVVRIFSFVAWSRFINSTARSHTLLLVSLDLISLSLHFRCLTVRFIYHVVHLKVIALAILRVIFFVFRIRKRIFVIFIFLHFFLFRFFLDLFNYVIRFLRLRRRLSGDNLLLRFFI